jgi:hypothetical protein
MRIQRSALAGITAAACAATLTIAACGGGGGGTNVASFCKNYHELSTVSGTDPVTLQKAADLYRKLADDASGSIKDDLNLLADDEIKVKNGDAASVDNDAAHAAADRADNYASSKC